MNALLRAHVSKCVPPYVSFAKCKSGIYKMSTMTLKLQNTVTFLIFGVLDIFWYLELPTARELSFALVFEFVQLGWGSHMSV